MYAAHLRTPSQLQCTADQGVRWISGLSFYPRAQRAGSVIITNLVQQTATPGLAPLLMSVLPLAEILMLWITGVLSA